MSDEIGRCHVQTLSGTFIVTETESEVASLLAEAPEFVRLTSVTGYYPPAPVTIHTRHLVYVVGFSERQWELTVASNRSHFAQMERGAQDGPVGMAA